MTKRENVLVSPTINGKADDHFVIQGEKYRITVLTSRMLRLEYQEEGKFEDLPTQIVWNRSFDKPAFQVQETSESLEIDTEFIHLFYDKQEMNENHLYIDTKYAFSNYGGRWYFGRTDYGDPPREHNLKGTTRTLDRVNGKWFKGANELEKVRTRGGKTNREDGDVDLGMGLCDTSGRTFLDDSQSLLIGEDGFVHPRVNAGKDIYFFGYGRDYFGAIHDFYQLSGPVPLLPRYALGNWWSKYYKYSEESYTALLRRFQQLNIPFSVVVLDMDWHLVDIPQQYGRGWTGWTWNHELFPDPDRFLRWLHENHYTVTLNLHPADGVRAYEKQYASMAQAMNVDPKSGLPVRFDATDPEFMKAYFQLLLHPEEERGVDFWWMDWQQGKICAIEGLDPLWILNHYHHFDLAARNKRGFMLSRYSGIGSHRYPVGFSGDVHVSWESLQYQPYFTATAANVGYTWWSHDIGGHIKGLKDSELYVRWIQFGVFSPINRLHCGNSPFAGKEPWRYSREAEEIAEDALRLRHRMLPYLYTMNAQCHFECKPIFVPLYYHYPMEMAAYHNRNAYFFGSELLIQPMVHPVSRETGWTEEESWIPEGVWTDVYTGYVHRTGKHGRHVKLCRPLSQQGVLAKAGAIVPMAAAEQMNNGFENPKTLEIYLFPGADNTYTLYEDSGEGFDYQTGAFWKTVFSLQAAGSAVNLSIRTEGDASIVPDKRTYVLHFRGFAKPAQIVTDGSFEEEYDESRNTQTVYLPAGDIHRAVSVTLTGTGIPKAEDEMKKRLFDLLDSFIGELLDKETIYGALINAESDGDRAEAILTLPMPESWRAPLLQLISG